MTAKKERLPGAGGLAASDYRTLAEFRYRLRLFAAFSEDAAQAEGLAPQQHQALLAIKGFAGAAPPTVGDLAERLAIRHNSAVGLVDRLVEARLIVRAIDSGDRRRVALALTRKAEALLAQLSAVHKEELRRIAPLLKSLLADIED